MPHSPGDQRGIQILPHAFSAYQLNGGSVKTGIKTQHTMERNLDWGNIQRLLEHGIPLAGRALPRDCNVRIQTIFFRDHGQEAASEFETAWTAAQDAHTMRYTWPHRDEELIRQLSDASHRANQFRYYIESFTPRGGDPDIEGRLCRRDDLPRREQRPIYDYDESDESVLRRSVFGDIPERNMRVLVWDPAGLQGRPSRWHVDHDSYSD